jgi:hypothetical protein
VWGNGVFCGPGWVIGGLLRLRVTRTLCALRTRSWGSSASHQLSSSFNLHLDHLNPVNLLNHQDDRERVLFIGTLARSLTTPPIMRNHELARVVLHLTICLICTAPHNVTLLPRFPSESQTTLLDLTDPPRPQDSHTPHHSILLPRSGDCGASLARWRQSLARHHHHQSIESMLLCSISLSGSRACG